jgi:hypothetical protein
MCQTTQLPLQQFWFHSGANPEFFWGGADPEAVYNLFDFKNYVIKIML